MEKPCNQCGTKEILLDGLVCKSCSGKDRIAVDVEVTKEEKEHFQRHFFNKSNSSRPSNFLEAVNNIFDTCDHKKQHKQCPPECPMKDQDEEMKKQKRRRYKHEEDPLWNATEDKKRRLGDSIEYEKIELDELDEGSNKQNPQEEGTNRRPRRPRASALLSVMRPTCPLCNQVVIVRTGEDPNEKMDEHIDLGCPRETESVYVPKVRISPKSHDVTPPKRNTGKPKKNIEIQNAYNNPSNLEVTKLNNKLKGENHFDGIQNGKEDSVCIVCQRHYKDYRTATQPEAMTEFFLTNKNFKGSLCRDDLLCKPCYTSYFDSKRKDRNESKEEIDFKKLETPKKENGTFTSFDNHQKTKEEINPTLKKEATLPSPSPLLLSKKKENFFGNGEEQSPLLKRIPTKPMDVVGGELDTSQELTSTESSPEGPSKGKKRTLKCRWWGPPVKKSTDKEYYYAVKLEKNTYYVGDCARFKASSGSRPFVGRIAALFEEDGQMLVECIWYFFPDDTAQGKKLIADSHEVFLSSVRDSNSIGCMEGPCEVLFESEFKLRKEKGLNLDSVFFCSTFYNAHTGTFKPIFCCPEENIYLSSDIERGKPFPNNEEKSISEEIEKSNHHHNNNHHYHQMEDGTLLSPPPPPQQPTTPSFTTPPPPSSPNNTSTVDDEEFDEVLASERIKANLLLIELCIVQAMSTGSQNEKRQKLPKNWPHHVQYTNSLLWDEKIPPKVKDYLCQDYCDDVEILPIPKDGNHPAAGQYGLFAKRDIPDGKIIGEYTGRVQLALKDESDKRYLSILYEDENIAVDIDAGRCGNEMRFVNDYRGTTASGPNVKYQRLKFGGMWHIMIISKKRIKKGKELLVDYGGATYWNNVKKI